MSSVVVIGAGLAGLSAACYLTGQGHEVTVVERESIPGGRAGRLNRDGFSFDTGPTVLTMPDLIADPLRAVGAELADLLPLKRLDPAYRARFADGSTIDVRHGHEAMRDEIARTCGSLDAAAFDDFVDWLRKLYLVELPHFIDANYDSPLGLVRSPAAVAKLVRLGAFGRLGNVVRKRFRDPRLHRLFSFQAMYAGLAPEAALAVYAVITYMDSIEGVWFPEGGMHSVPRAMAQAAEKAGASFRYGDAVDSILRSPTGRVAGVGLASGVRLRADAVVCTIDLPVAYQTLLADLTPPRAAVRGRYSPSAVVWHVGVRGLPEGNVAHHNIHFGAEWGSAFEALLKDGRLMPDPSRLVTVPSLDEPTMAPPECSGALRAGARAQPQCQHRLDPRGPGDARPTAWLHCRPGLSERRGDRGTGDPPGLAAPGNGGRHALRAGAQLRPDRARSGHPMWNGGCPVCSSPARAPCQASECRWC